MIKKQINNVTTPDQGTDENLSSISDFDFNGAVKNNGVHLTKKDKLSAKNPFVDYSDEYSESQVHTQKHIEPDSRQSRPESDG